MPRRVRVEDIISSNHRSIRDVSFAHSASASTKSGHEIAIHRVRESPKKMSVTPPMPKQKASKWQFRWLAVTLGIFVIIASAGYLASTYYSEATFTIVPKVISIPMNGTKPYVAYFEETAKDDALIYKLAVIKNSTTTTIAAKNGAKINTKSTGKVTLYNSFSPQSIRLIAGTRLIGENGLMYRLTGSVVIPGYTKSSGAIIAGKTVVNIIADKTGQDYNIFQSGTLNERHILKIAAYRGSAKYESVYARLTSDVTGGFSGVKKIINPIILTSAVATLKSNLTATLLSQMKLSIPNGYVMYDNGYMMAFDALIIDEGKSDVAVITEQGALYAILFQKDALINALAENKITSLFGTFAYTAPGLESLDVVFNNLKDFSPDKKNTVIIHAKGNMKLVGTVPVDEIKTKLMGISLADTESVFKSYGSVIKSATGGLLPPWAKIPKDISRINIVVEKE